MSLYSLLNKTVYIQHKTVSSNAWGEQIASYNTSSSAKCRIAPIRDELRLLSPGEYQNVDLKAYFLSGTSITYDDRILYDNNTYRIRSIKKDSINHHITVLLERLP